MAKQGDTVWVVVETPSGSRWKYAWDPEHRAFRAHKLLPLGITFPYEFGFISNTHADDGDPLDALVIADAPPAVGTHVECRVLGAYEVEQSEEGDTKPVRNDRVVVVPVQSQRGASWRSLADLGQDTVDEIAAFFEDYVNREGRTFRLLGTVEDKAAKRLVKQAH